eukprot:2101749-Rhodomonas_salina.2
MVGGARGKRASAGTQERARGGARARGGGARGGRSCGGGGRGEGGEGGGEPRGGGGGGQVTTRYWHRNCHAVCGTEIAYGASRLAPLLSDEGVTSEEEFSSSSEGALSSQEEEDTAKRMAKEATVLMRHIAIPAVMELLGDEAAMMQMYGTECCSLEQLIPGWVVSAHPHTNSPTAVAAALWSYA